MTKKESTKKISVVVLVDCSLGESGAVVEIDEADLAAYAGMIDANPKAVNARLENS